MTQTIQLERDGAIATLWLDRPAKRNALDAELVRGFAGALDEVATDAAVRVVVVRGRGQAFSSGIDHSLLLEVFQSTQRAPFLHVHHQLQDTFHRMSRLQKPVIAVLHGVAVGMGLELALAADVRIATPDCVFGLPEIAFGIVPDVGGTTRLVRTVGEPRARELILTGRMFRGARALDYGLVHELAATDALDAIVKQRADALAAHPPAAVGLAKTLCQLSAETDAGTSFRFEGIVQQALIAKPDPSQFAAGVAFIKAGIAAAD